ncbi:aldo/keto reductase [Planctomycetota bacterium]|nr:aldo/keto reductase [Planctomycetota bacterium]
MLGRSFDVSLEQLGLTYVDTLLLHNFVQNEPILADVVDWFADLRRSGRAKRTEFSVEGDLNEALSCLESHGWLDGSVIQAPVASILDDLPRSMLDVEFIAHSPFSFLASEAARAGGYGPLRDLLEALVAFRRCETLVCSMVTKSHLESNVAAHQALAAGL